ncbi:DUF192 domain-containing protein [Polymorphum gilvum]|uniref:Hypothetical signal peptide protein n=1 Tax=Polymorphum gilvum (strain LMG 25793 / CGMCC 1.9160 / SL003B-26A1) TaxID=991905 RepID=F2IX93_POLGS|nr:DUF192 domain-containing protein [Polymorphum gilvum]ADZ70411.1 Hypothetical signal peptide protein [Polymorphum gilvum SL003B-26A1]
MPLPSVLAIPFRVLLLVLAVAVASAQASELPRERLSVETASGPHRFEVEVAADSASRARGLMDRREMAADAGMLFVFEDTGEKHFWMKNTYLSLDMIFIGADGRIVHIAENTVPLSEKVVGSNGPARYVLEVLAGTSARLGFAPGDRVVASSIRVMP